MMLPANNIFRAFYRVFSNPPAALDVAVMAPVYRKKPADNRDFAKVRPKSRPESIPRAGEVVRPHHVKNPVPHVTTPVCEFRMGGAVIRVPAAGWRGRMVSLSIALRLWSLWTLGRYFTLTTPPPASDWPRSCGEPADVG